VLTPDGQGGYKEHHWGPKGSDNFDSTRTIENQSADAVSAIAFGASYHSRQILGFDNANQILDKCPVSSIISTTESRLIRHNRWICSSDSWTSCTKQTIVLNFSRSLAHCQSRQNFLIKNLRPSTKIKQQKVDTELANWWVVSGAAERLSDI
jgi:hypothetical protein